MNSIVPQLLLQVILIFLNAFFAAAEIAVISLNATKLRKSAEDGDKTCARLLKLVEEPSGFFWFPLHDPDWNYTGRFPRQCVRGRQLFRLSGELGISGSWFPRPPGFRTGYTFRHRHYHYSFVLYADFW